MKGNEEVVLSSSGFWKSIRVLDLVETSRPIRLVSGHEDPGFI